MELGEKLLRARQEAGLSQRQLCGDVITRNMLSQIEHGTAHPSMDTLRYLAGRLGKPVSYFLEEDVVVSANQPLMEQARQAWQAGQTELAREILKQYRQPDAIFDWEWKYLSVTAALAAAEKALSDEKPLYARQLLEEAAVIEQEIPGLERQRLLLLGRIPGADLTAISAKLPSLDEELLLRAEAALTRQETSRAAGLLAAAENREDPRWNLLRGQTYVLQKQHAMAAECLEKAEAVYPKECWPLLEVCFRETGDFQKAYEYACKQR
ncbi:MAG: helix-turn-helix domain-containing protein [Oscillospiraceae bacterium]|nr:helix-turn-helix domain-containing protein [Oscillospiraceae bacterium]